MPTDNRTVYEGWFGAVTGLGILVGPVIGNFIMNRLPVIETALLQHSKFQLMYFLSFLLSGAVMLFLLKGSKDIDTAPVTKRGVTI